MSQNSCIPNLVVRRLHSFDQPTIVGHLLRLDTQSRQQRFCGMISDAGIKKYAAKILSYDSIVCGAFVDGELRGLAELRGVSPVCSTTAEAAFSVEPNWQDVGIGNALFERLFAIAQNRGIPKLQMMCLKANSRIQYLAVKHHAHLVWGSEEVEAIFIPNGPTPLSLAKEFIGESKAYANIFFGWSARTGIATPN